MTRVRRGACADGPVHPSLLYDRHSNVRFSAVSVVVWARMMTAHGGLPWLATMGTLYNPHLRPKSKDARARVRRVCTDIIWLTRCGRAL